MTIDAISGATWAAALVVGASLVTTGCAGTPATASTAAGKPTMRKRDRLAANSAIARMLAERQRKKRPSIPGHKLVREAEDAVDRQRRILALIDSRLRRSQRVRDLGTVHCLSEDRAAVAKIYKSSEKWLSMIEAALRKRDRAGAEGLWLRVRVADMQVREYVHKRCEGRVHVQVEIVSPAGKRSIRTGVTSAPPADDARRSRVH